MFRGARRALHFAGVNLIAFLRSIPGYFATWPMQELTGTTAIADNVALALGRRLNGLTYADYVAGAGWADGGSEIAVGTAVAVAVALTQTITGLEVGKTYQVIFVLSNYVGGSIRPDIMGSTGTSRFADDTYTEQFTATAGAAQLAFTSTGGGAFTGDIDLKTVLVKQTGILDSGAYPGADVASHLYADYTPGVGWSDSGSEVAHCDGSQVGNSSLTDINSAIEEGRDYAVKFTVSNYSAGGVRLLLPGAATAFKSSDGELTQTITAGAGTGLVALQADVNFIGDSDLKLLEVTPANPLNGDYVGVALAQPGAGNITYFVAFGGAADYLTVLSAEHNSALNPLSFEIVIFGNDFTWDANVRTLLNYYVDASNYIRIDKTAVAGQLAVYYQEQGEALVTQLIATGSPAGIFSVGIGVESNVFQATYNGAQVGANQATTSAFVGNFTIMTIGALNTAPTNVTLGSLAYPVEFTTQLSAATRLQIKSAFGVS